jgi:hypothetical protein
MNGSAASADSDESATAPRNAPTKPGRLISRTQRHSTLPKRVCDAADTATVPTSARCTVADATAGAEPIASSSVVDDTPYAMPSAPSISCAAKR